MNNKECIVCRRSILFGSICKNCLEFVERAEDEMQAKDEELASLRAANAELAEALRSLRPIVEAIHTALATMPTDPELQCLYDEADGLVEAIDAALSRAEQAKPKADTCGWRYNPAGFWNTACGSKCIGLKPMTYCGKCNKRVEVKR